MTKQNLFTEEELAKVTDEAERKHLIECAQDQSKIDMKYMEIMSNMTCGKKGSAADTSTQQHMKMQKRSCRTE